MLTGLKILVAEDNVLSQKVADYVLQKNGAIVDAALNGLQAISLLEKNSYDLIIMDLHMPEMGGYEATEYIRITMKNNVPIIGLTASTLDEDLDACIKIGMYSCVAKPIKPEVLCQLILDAIKDNKKDIIS